MREEGYTEVGGTTEEGERERVPHDTPIASPALGLFPQQCPCLVGRSGYGRVSLDEGLKAIICSIGNRFMY